MANEEMPSFGTEEFQVATEPAQTRPGALIVLALAVLGGGGYLFYKHGPASASAAAPTALTEPNEAQKSIAEFLQMGGQNISQIERGLRNTEQVVKQFNSYAEMTQVPLSELKSNPFRMDKPKEPEGLPSPSAALASPFAEDAKAALAAQRQKAAEAAGKLKIDFILTGRGNTGASAMIDGHMVRAGDKVGTFTVESIKPGVVVLRDGTMRFERRLGQ